MATRSVDELRALEESLWVDSSRNSPEWMDAVLSPDFFEIGASGRVHQRAELLQPLSGPVNAELPLEDYSAVLLDSQTALVTYVSTQRAGSSEVRRARRTSIWTALDGTWRLRFHQGTPLGECAES